MSGLSLEWQWSCPPSTVDVKPLVVILPWVWSEPQYVNKYTQLCHQNGWDVVVARWPMLALWFPLWSRALAASLICALGTELRSRGNRPVVFWSFSGAAKGVYASLLSQLAAPQQLKPQEAACAAAVLRCAVGQVFDSGPVDFSSDMGRKLLSPNSSSSSSRAGQHSTAGDSSSTAAAVGAAARAAADMAVSAGVNVAAGTLDFFLMEWFDRDRDNMWSALSNTPVGGPVLLLYSRGDELADAAQIAGLAASLKRRGRRVVEQVWHDSPHVGHLRAHPLAFSEAVSYLLAQALQEWSDRSSRRWEGRDWTLRWQQQQQQGEGEEDGGCGQTGAMTSLSSSSSIPPGHTAGSGVVTSNYAPPQQLHLPTTQSCNAAQADGHELLHDSNQPESWHQPQFDHHQQQQQQQLVMQPTKGIWSTGRFRGGPSRSHHASSSSSINGRGSSASRRSGSHDGRQTATLVRSGTSGTSSSSSTGNGGNGGGDATTTAAAAAALTYAARRAEVLAQQLTPWLLSSQMAFDGSNGGGSSSSNGSSGQQYLPAVVPPIAGTPTTGSSRSIGGVVTGPGSGRGGGAPAVVRISSWPATATAVAAAMSAGPGNEPVCADSTLLSHSLRCLASSFMATHMSAGGGPAASSSAAAAGGSSEAAAQVMLQQHQGGRDHLLLGRQAGAAVQQQEPQPRQEHSRQQQQQPFMLRMVNRLRSRL